jgi:hypothetical protein
MRYAFFLPPHNHIGASFNQIPHPPAVLVLIAQAMGRHVVDQNSTASFRSKPYVWPAAGSVDTLIPHPQCGAVIHQDIG